MHAAQASKCMQRVVQVDVPKKANRIQSVCTLPVVFAVAAAQAIRDSSESNKWMPTYVNSQRFGGNDAAHAATALVGH